MKLWFVFALLFAACAATHAHEPTQREQPPLEEPSLTVRVAFVDGNDWTAWRADQRETLRAYLPLLSRVGVRFEQAIADNSDVLVRSWDSGDKCARGVGRYVVGSRSVEVDAACAGGADGLRFAVGHELLHWLTSTHTQWAGHICKRGDEARDCHESIRGRALLNPTLPESEFGGASFAVVDYNPQQADRELLEQLGIVSEQ